MIFCQNLSRCLYSHLSKDSYPEVSVRIAAELKGLRAVGVPLDAVSIRAIMVSIMSQDAPEIFDRVLHDHSKFRCSESFVKKYLRDVMGWSLRASTRAAQKLPDNWETVLDEAFLREAWIIRNHNIPAELRVNTDQTQTIYQQGTKTTWNKKGEIQIPVIGKEEKRAFTLVPSISASGELLPMQAIYVGTTIHSRPSPDSPHYDEAMSLGFRLESSCTDNYWSTMTTMKSLVDNIIAPYFDRQKKALGIESPELQSSSWKIDCWSVHRSVEFLTWMKVTHPNIIVTFVPGNCTCVFQPLDVGIQRVLKQSMKCSCHRDVVAEISEQLAKKKAADAIRFDTTVGTLRNRSLGWIVKAYHDINKPELIKKASKFLPLPVYRCLNSLSDFCRHSNYVAPGTLICLMLA